MRYSQVLVVSEPHIGSDRSTDGRQQVYSLFQRSRKWVGTEICCLSNSYHSPMGAVSLFTMLKGKMESGQEGKIF